MRLVLLVKMAKTCYTGKSGSGKSLSAQRLMRIFDGVVGVVYHIGVTRGWDADMPDYPDKRNSMFSRANNRSVPSIVAALEAI